MQDNFVGASANGTTALANGYHGIAIADGTPDNTIAGSLVAANMKIGIAIYGAGERGTT